MVRIGVIAILMATLSASAIAQTTKPAAENIGAMELRAQTAFDKGDYATALPLFMNLEKKLTDKPDKLGPLQEKIRVCKKNLLKDPPRDLQNFLTQKPQDNATPEKRKPHIKPKDGQALEIAIKDLGNFEYDAEKGGNIPEDVKQLHGAKIRTHGFMIPLDQADNITEFALVPSLFACCFGQPPQVQHTMVVHTPKGKAVGYFPDEIIVEGTLKVDEKKEDGLIISVFEVDCISVKPMPK
ncbi:MAG TPA: DUF3299 domain-containing protein [Tepidisphaeraceae bacterium]|jgi:hypothetical protein|nr:DUF3299 domain-containing protein [Tepidisphaeraceae bacterium]